LKIFQFAKHDSFSLVPLLLISFANIAFGIYLAAFVTSTSDPMLIFTLFFIACFVFLVAKLLRRQWRKAISLIFAFPLCGIASVYFSGLGIDGAQVGFWTTYAYYRSQVIEGNAQRFKWSEDGLFLGGGWINSLVYDPSDADWKNLALQIPVQNNALGLGYVTQIKISNEDNCDMRTLKRLSSHWYFQTQYYGGGFICK
jgi:energy-coupling factor transporter transmembrane protein EcfT